MTITETTKAQATVPSPFDYRSLPCPLPGCEADLHLEWNTSRPLFAGDLAVGEDLPAPDDAHVASWQVTCEDGHVVLVPARALCPCDADECDHADVDASDEFRTFRAHDLDRLRETLAALPAKEARIR